MRRSRFPNRRVILGMVLGGLMLAATDYAGSEAFGQRTSGAAKPRAGQSRQGNEAAAPGLEAVGSIVDEDARFLRGNRSADAFVGRDAAEGRAFVGSQQAATDAEVRSAIDEPPRTTNIPDVNQQQQPAIPPRLQLNAPRLQVGFVTNGRPTADVSRQLTTRLQSKLAAAGSTPIEVSMADGEALLRGWVASARDRKLAELLVRFEPGVNRVRNELQVAPGSPEPLPQLPPASSRSPRG